MIFRVFVENETANIGLDFMCIPNAIDIIICGHVFVFSPSYNHVSTISPNTIYAHQVHTAHCTCYIIIDSNTVFCHLFSTKNHFYFRRKWKRKRKFCLLCIPDEPSHRNEYCISFGFVLCQSQYDFHIEKWIFRWI